MKRLAQFGLLVSLPLVLACAKGNKGADKAQAVADSARVDTTTMADRQVNRAVSSLPSTTQGDKVRSLLLEEARYEKKDSDCIVRLLAEARQMPASTNWMVHFGRKFLHVPYVAKTLDRELDEHLVVNTRELDCTTFVETVLALDQCMRHEAYGFTDFLTELRRIRYLDGKMAYTNRQHYFTVWINNNQKMGIVEDIQSPNPPFTAVQHLKVNWMTTHTKDYPQLAAHPEWVAGIRRMEQSISRKSYRYIPKATIANTRLFRQTIHDGDILVILTSKQGLDTSHIGIAVWHQDGLHLLNASYLRHKVVEESMTLHRYMQGQRSQTGLRVCRAK